MRTVFSSSVPMPLSSPAPLLSLAFATSSLIIAVTDVCTYTHYENNLLPPLQVKSISPQ